MKLIVFLSTGRCGTQFFATALSEAAGDRAVVVHEPIEALYAPKQTLRAPDLESLLPRYPAVEAHFDEIMRTTESGRLYVETGWPVFSWIPLLLRRFGEEALVVHLTRNPVRFAYSHASTGMHTPELRGDSYVHLAQLDPSDPGVRYRDYEQDWETLNPAEKGLFQWLEINGWAEELKAAHPDSFITLRSEDALAEPQSLFDALIERRAELAGVFREHSLPDEMIDRFHLRVGFEVKPLRYRPEVEALAERCGYSMDFGEEDLELRFSRNLRGRRG